MVRIGASALLLTVAACGGSDSPPGTQQTPSFQLTGTYTGTQQEGALTCTAGSLPLPEGVIAAPFTQIAWRELEQVGTRLLIRNPGERSGAFLGTANVEADGRVTWVDTATITNGPARAPSTHTRFGGTWLLQASADGSRLQGSRMLVVEEFTQGTGAVISRCTRSEAVDLTRRTTDVPTLSTGACTEESGLQSVSASTPAMVLFRNTRSQSVEVFWRDYQGRRVSMGTLAAGAQGAATTWVTHPFVVADATGRCLGTFMPIAGPAVATIP